MRTVGLIGCAAIVVAGAACIPLPVPEVPGGPGGGGTPTVVVDSPAHLADGQRVGVRGTGFEPGETAIVYQCAAEPVGMVDCDYDTAIPVEVAADGSFAAESRVFALLHGWGQSSPNRLDCRVAGNCVIAASLGFEAGAEPVTAALTLDPAGPLLPATSIEVSPATGLVDGATVRVVGSGFVRSGGRRLRGAPPVRIYQCAPGEFGPSGSCRAVPTGTLAVDDDGGFSTDVPVSTVTVSNYYETADCRTHSQPCYLLATRGRSLDEGADIVARTDLHFDPDAPVLPPPSPTISVTPAADLHDGRSPVPASPPARR